MFTAQISIQPRGVTVTDRDGDVHTARSPEDLWALVYDLAGQRSENDGHDGSSTALAVPKGDVAAVRVDTRQGPTEGPEVEEVEEVGENMFSKMFARVGVAGIESLGRISATSGYHRGGRGRW